jgi:hypothetical protein
MDIKKNIDIDDKIGKSICGIFSILSLIMLFYIIYDIISKAYISDKGIFGVFFLSIVTLVFIHGYKSFTND